MANGTGQEAQSAEHGAHTRQHEWQEAQSVERGAQGSGRRAWITGHRLCHPEPASKARELEKLLAKDGHGAQSEGHTAHGTRKTAHNKKVNAT